ncbi:hypothetical protein [Pseudomonas vanderleydeniana]|uniref:hypothetical protein n=1 Tax=Pseudomonas vanderleydeniana TaxID=2745495 RepID=UPI001647E871|nr:hypothetical protein [Pseudomonas vanderleydeniana]
MVKAGFIVEGASERIVVESQAFRALLQSCGYELVTPVVDANGGGNLLPHNIEAFLDRLDEAGAEEVFILTDLEDELHVRTVRDRVAHQRVRFAFVAVKALEAWFLADTQAMNAWLKTDDFFEDTPEQTAEKPWERVKQVAAERGARGPGNKVAFAKKAVTHWGFSVEHSSAHPSCPSARELIEFLRSTG